MSLPTDGSSSAGAGQRAKAVPTLQGSPARALDAATDVLRTSGHIRGMKRDGHRIVMVTAYDAVFASLVDSAGVDVILVGDSVAPVLCGESNTIPATLPQMIYHGRCVRRGTSNALVLVDLPFLSYQVSVPDAVRNAGAVMKRTGAGAVKLEGGARWAPTVEALVASGIPVMGHIGVTPQTAHLHGGARVESGDSAVREELVSDARALEAAGAFAVVLAGVAAPIAAEVTDAIGIPTIGYDSGPACDGQVLMSHDLLGLREGLGLTTKYADLAPIVRDAIRAFGTDVRSRSFAANGAMSEAVSY